MKIEFEGTWEEIQAQCREVAPPSPINVQAILCAGMYDCAEVAVQLHKGNFVGAIKQHRQVTGSALKDSKDFIDSLKIRMGL